MDQVFRALVDPSRRRLLDALRDRDGQTLTELCAVLPSMTRFGVMNHLRVLEEADLVTTVRRGRSKHHYLNAVTIQLIYDRWIKTYARFWAGGIAGLRTALEGGSEVKPAHIYQTYIRCEPQAAWDAITDGEMTRQYFYGTRVESAWTPEAPVRYLGGDGAVVAEGEVISVDAPRRLEMTFHAKWDPEIEAEGPVRMVWLLGEENGLTRLTVEYYGMEEGSRAYQDFSGGISYIVAGLKTLLETGEGIAA